ncbi:MAG: hypothetical protein MJ211_11835 [Bacteroidales bacterium]|nr:hypothetical protein [Bacteroidales bacterium]
MNLEQEFLEKLAQAYKNYDASLIETYLSEDIHYASMWVFEEITSKKDYLEYLNGKLETLKKHEVIFDSKIIKGRMHEFALLVTNQKTENGVNFGFVADFNEFGKVKMLNITAEYFF